MSAPDGGPAFPSVMHGTSTSGEPVEFRHPGMSLRDAFLNQCPPPPAWFYAEVLGWPMDIPNRRGFDDIVAKVEDCIQKRFDSVTMEQDKRVWLAWRPYYADAMLAARAKEVPHE